MQSIEYGINDVVAIVVSYNGGDIRNSIDKLLRGINKVIIIDNNSNKASKDYLKEIKNKIILIELTVNMGQAYALNIGAREAIKQGAKLIMTMDQDTIIYEGTIRKMLDAINAGFDSVGPNYKFKKNNKKYILVKYLITSCNLFKSTAFETVNGFTNELFIDGVDFDFSLKLRKYGYRLAIVRDAYVKHDIGEKNDKTKVYEHSISRHYYISRNHYYIIRKYIFFDFIFCIHLKFFYVWGLLNLFRESDAFNKYKACYKGRQDSKKMRIVEKR